MDMTILNVALPEMAAELRLTSVSQLWVVDAYALALAGLLVPITALGDRWGRKRMLITGYAAFAVGSVAILWAESAAAVIAIRVLLGIGGAMVMPSTLSLIRSIFVDPRERTLALSIWGATAALGAAVGPVVGGALLESFSWHSAFLVNVPLMLVAIAAGAWLLRENRSQRPGRIDAVGILLSAGGMTAFVYAAKQLGKHGPSLPTLALLAAGVVALAAFVRIALASDRPMLDVRLFRSAVLRAGVVAALASSAAMAAVLFVGSQWLQLVQGRSPLEAGIALLPMAVGAMIASPFAPAMAARTSPRIVLTGGLLVLSAGLALLAVLPATYPWVALAFAVVGLGTSALGLGLRADHGHGHRRPGRVRGGRRGDHLRARRRPGHHVPGQPGRCGLPGRAAGRGGCRGAGVGRRSGRWAVLHRCGRRLRPGLRLGRGGRCGADRPGGVRRVATGAGRPVAGRCAALIPARRS